MTLPLVLRNSKDFSRSFHTFQELLQMIFGAPRDTFGTPRNIFGTLRGIAGT